jgi:MFS family permease
VAQAAVPSAVGLGATRALQGAFSAAVVPAAYSLLADLFAAKDFASANSKFTTGIYVGGAVASLSTLVDEQVCNSSSMQYFDVEPTKVSCMARTEK